MRLNEKYTDGKEKKSRIHASIAYASSLLSFLSCVSSAFTSPVGGFSTALFSFPFGGSFSFSSSLSPRLNGSFSATGDGSTIDSGCHLLDLPPGAAPPNATPCLGMLLLVSPVSPPGISSGGPSWKATRRALLGDWEWDLSRNRSGFANGRVGRGGSWGADAVSREISCDASNLTYLPSLLDEADQSRQEELEDRHHIDHGHHCVGCRHYAVFGMSVLYRLGPNKLAGYSAVPPRHQSFS